MIVQRGLGNSTAPAVQSRINTNPTLLFSWWCTGFAVAIVFVRVYGRLVRNNRLFQEDKIMAFSLVPLLLRMGLVHVILIWQTNNVDISGGLSERDIFHRSIGSRLVLVSRILYALYIWMAKFTVSEFLKRLTASYWKHNYDFVLHCIRVFLVVTFIGVVIATLSECQPFSHYWQVVPDPGPRCRQGYAHLLTMGVADMVTDILIVVFPVSIIVGSGMPLVRKLKLIPLFGLNAALIVITICRLLGVIDNSGRQQLRTVYASGEILAATAVSNAVVLGSFLRDRGVKKTKYKRNSTTDSSEGPSSRRLTLTQQQFGSDENLFSGMCYRLSHDDVESAVPRPAPIATNPEGRSGSGDQTWNIPNFEPKRLDSLSPASKARQDSTAGPHESIKLHKTVTFSDPGGLLDIASSQASTVVGSPSSHQLVFKDRKGSQDSDPAITEVLAGNNSQPRSGGKSDQFHDVGGLLN